MTKPIETPFGLVIPFESYDEYVYAQAGLTRRKLAKPSYRAFISPMVVSAISQRHGARVRQGMCHGVRDGAELRMFRDACGGTWIGTEITPELCDDVEIIHCDFETVRNEWIGQMNMIYSNSLDHSQRPWCAVRAWLACLAHGGRLYVEWTPWHARLGRHGHNGDCYAATSGEYKYLLGEAGRVEDVLIVPDVAGRYQFERHIFVVR